MTDLGFGPATVPGLVGETSVRSASGQESLRPAGALFTGLRPVIAESRQGIVALGRFPRWTPPERGEYVTL